MNHVLVTAVKNTKNVTGDKVSADNGVYILRTRKGTGFEYRVRELQAVENVDWDHNKWNDEYKRLGNYTDDDDVRIMNAREMWANVPVFALEDEAFDEAKRLYDETMADYGILEYGVAFIEIDREF